MSNRTIEKVEIIGAENQDDQPGFLKLHVFDADDVDEVVDVPRFPKRDDFWKLFIDAKDDVLMSIGGPVCKTALNVFELEEDAWDTGFAIQGIPGFIFRYEYQPEKIVKDGNSPDVPAHFKLILHGRDPKSNIDEGFLFDLLGNAALNAERLDRALSYDAEKARRERDEASKTVEGLRREIAVAHDQLASLSLRLNQETANSAVSAKKIDVLTWTVKQYAEKSNWGVGAVEFKGPAPGMMLAQEALSHPIFGGHV
jgi:hypothetical protein